MARVSPLGQDAVLKYRHPWLAQMVPTWNGTPSGAWLDWRDGRIVVKNPDAYLDDQAA